MTENRYLYYLPNTVKELQEFQKLAEIEGGILKEEAAAKEELIGNQWILTAERSGLLRLSGMMGLYGAEGMETEALRAEILSRWSSRSPYTLFHLRDWLDDCLGMNGYAIKVVQERYLLQVILGLHVKDRKGFLEKNLRKIIPANLLLEVKLNGNTHNNLKVMTHGKMKAFGWRWGQIVVEDLSAYE
ncbi:MAG: DUF2313 domain-containing protein [Anaerotignum sp.]|nr:DUF2313 domain-containing protein [Anaerotignum sp.]